MTSAHFLYSPIVITQDTTKRVADSKLGPVQQRRRVMSSLSISQRIKSTQARAGSKICPLLPQTPSLKGDMLFVMIVKAFTFLMYADYKNKRRDNCVAVQKGQSEGEIK